MRPRKTAALPSNKSPLGCLTSSRLSTKWKSSGRRPLLPVIKLLAGSMAARLRSRFDFPAAEIRSDPPNLLAGLDFVPDYLTYALYAAKGLDRASISSRRRERV